MRSIALAVGIMCFASETLALTGCATTPGAVCASGLGSPMQVFDLFFGRAIPGRNDLTQQEWQSFLDDVVTANLPNGYTVLDAAGAWRNPVSRKTIQEPTYVILVALPREADNLAVINRIRTAYQIRFHQQLVGMTVAEACGSF